MWLPFPKRLCFRASQVALAWLGIAICLAIGCNSDPNCRRETALLRAEIIDWEDKYALLKARYEERSVELAAATGQPVESTMISSLGDYQGRIIEQSVDAMYAPGTVLPDGSIVVSDPAIVENGMVIDQSNGQVWNQPSNVVDQTMTNNSVLGSPSLTQPRSIGESNAPVIREPENLPQALPIVPQGNEEMPIVPNESIEGTSLPTLQGNVAYNRQISNRRASAAITEVVINRDGTRGHSVDRVPGDEGLNLLIQPRSSNGRVVLAAGELTISVIDPKEPAESNRVGLWKFLPEETELFFANDELASQGILLKLPWDQATPKRSKLMVHVRYVTPDGRVLKTSSGVRIKPPSATYSSDAPEVVKWSQQDWRWAGSQDDDPSVFELELPADSSAGSDDVFASDIERDWQRANGRKPNRASSVNANGFRIGGSRSQPVADKADSRKPQWRPVR